jgi:hypothetical protein
MGYSRNYLKYWEERSKRKRDEARNSVNDDILSGGGIVNSGPMGEVLTDTLDNSFSIVDIDHDDDTSSSETIENLSTATLDGSVVASVTSGSSISLNSMQFSEQLDEKTSVPMQEACSFQIMRLLDKAGSPRYLYDELKALLHRKQVSNNGFQVSKAMSRDALMKSLFDRFPCPDVDHCRVSNHDVNKFPFVGMLQDLLDRCGSEMTIDLVGR